MTIPSSDQRPTLDDARTRFLNAESQLTRATETLLRLEAGIRELTEARTGLREAGSQIQGVRDSLSEAASAVRSSVGTLSDGVAVLKETEEARVVQRLAALDRALVEIGQRLEAVMGEAGTLVTRVGDLGRDVVTAQGRQAEVLASLEASLDSRLAGMTNEVAGGRNQLAAGLAQQVRIGEELHASVARRMGDLSAEFPQMFKGVESVRLALRDSAASTKRLLALILVLIATAVGLEILILIRR